MNISFQQSFMLVLLIFTGLGCNAQNNMKTLSKNGMNVSWHHEGDRIFFEMDAPTDGWVTIGFNETTQMKDVYLLMGRVIKGQAELVEHFTIGPGNYVPIESFGIDPQVKNVEGTEKGKFTKLSFSLPIQAISIYRKSLEQGKKYVMLLAYSQGDDFQHHSIMRTSAQVEL